MDDLRKSRSFWNSSLSDKLGNCGKWQYDDGDDDDDEGNGNDDIGDSNNHSGAVRSDRLWCLHILHCDRNTLIA